MIEQVFAVGLLAYVLLIALKLFSKEKFDKIVYHSKVTRIVAQIISGVGGLTIFLGLMMFISVSVLSLVQSGLFTQTIVNNEWDKPVLLFLTGIGAMVIVLLPFVMWVRLPFYGEDSK